MGSTESRDNGLNWKPDSTSICCDSCDAPFSFLRRRHHCRNCGGVFCDDCSSSRIELPNRGIGKKVRVCFVCLLKVDAETSNSSPPTPTSRRKSDVSSQRGQNDVVAQQGASSAPSGNFRRR
jgi:hypothetical protein